MKAMLLLVLLVGLTGCARHYAIRMNNGVRITSASKPKLQGGYYIYKDLNGQLASVPQGRVSEIGPASRMGNEKSPFKPQTAR